ncbi:MAG TPA: hypothetical protein VN436_00170, partial [Holophaga sp.]|nr:hypothetical protein [Holophaga sp.]
MSIFRPAGGARLGRGFPSGRTSGKLGGMSTSFPVPALPAVWPFTPREAGEAPHGSREADLGALGSGWTLLLRGQVPLGTTGGALPRAFGRGG